MKKIILYSILFFFSASMFAQSNQVKFIIDHQVGSNPLISGTTQFEIWNGKNTVIDRAEFYISEISLTDENDVETPLTDVHILVDAFKNEQTYDLGIWDINSVKTVKLYVGVDEAHNHLDPTTYPAGHPLAPQNPSMHWGWAAGYRFMALEGMIDNNGDGNSETMYQYHNLGDDLYFGTALNGLAVAENGNLEIRITLEYSKLFENLSMSGNVIQHGSNQQNKLMLENAVNSGFMTMETVSSAKEVKANSATIHAFPNPANLTTQLSYDFENVGGSLSISVIDMLGRSLTQEKSIPSTGTYILDTSLFPSGIYQVVFHYENNLLARKQIQVTH